MKPPLAILSEIGVPEPMTPYSLELEFPAADPSVQWPGPPTMTVAEWAEWLEEARQLQNPEALEAWLREGIPNGPRFELLDAPISVR